MSVPPNSTFLALFSLFLVRSLLPIFFAPFGVVLTPLHFISRYKMTTIDSNTSAAIKGLQCTQVAGGAEHVESRGLARTGGWRGAGIPGRKSGLVLPP